MKGKYEAPCTRYAVIHIYDSDNDGGDVIETQKPTYDCEAMYDFRGNKLPFCFKFDYEAVHQGASSFVDDSDLEDMYDNGDQGEPMETEAVSAPGQSGRPTVPAHSNGIVHGDFLTLRDQDRVLVFDSSTCRSHCNRAAYKAENVYRALVVVFWPRLRTLEYSTAHCRRWIAIKQAKTCAEAEDNDTAMNILEAMMQMRALPPRLSTGDFAEMVKTCSVMGPQASQMVCRIVSCIKAELLHVFSVDPLPANKLPSSYFCESLSAALIAACDSIGTPDLKQSLIELASELPLCAVNEHVVTFCCNSDVVARVPELECIVFGRFIDDPDVTTAPMLCYMTLITCAVLQDRLFGYVQVLAGKMQRYLQNIQNINILMVVRCLSKIQGYLDGNRASNIMQALGMQPIKCDAGHAGGLSSSQSSASPELARNRQAFREFVHALLDTKGVIAQTLSGVTGSDYLDDLAETVYACKDPDAIKKLVTCALDSDSSILRESALARSVHMAISSLYHDEALPCVLEALGQTLVRRKHRFAPHNTILQAVAEKISCLPHLFRYGLRPTNGCFCDGDRRGCRE